MLVLLFMAADVVAIVMAVLVSNLSEKKQYPMYWSWGVEKLFLACYGEASAAEEVEPLDMADGAVSKSSSTSIEEERMGAADEQIRLAV